jgi:hypothetical protein
MNALIDGALDWAGMGIPVFPCGGNKAPLTENGFKDAVTDPDAVRKLFEFYGSSAKMIGARMGEESGLFAIDFDLYKGDIPQSYMQELIDSGNLPDTRMHKTKSGGLHAIYSHSSEWPNVVPVSGVEIKGEGGYIIVPPSKGYEVVREGVVDAPDTLIKQLTMAKAKLAGRTTDAIKMRILAAEDFHDNLRSLSAKLLARGLEPATVMLELSETMAASVAANAEHPRHDRWAAIMADSGKEFTRLVTTGYDKYSSSAASEKAREHSDKYEGLRKAAASAGFKEHQDTPEGTSGEVKQVEDYGEDWPFEGAGYFASEDHDLLNQKYVMHPFFAEDETTVLFAEPKMGKTAWNVTASLHIACGMDYGPSLKVTEARPCLYYALEGSRAIKLRIAAWRKDQKEAGVQLPSNIPLFVVERSQNFLKEDERKAACNQIIAANNYCIKHHGSALGVISLDTLTKAMSSGDQNSVEDTSALFELVGLLREGGVSASIVFVHHKARTGGVRGSTNIEAEPDVLLDVSKGKVDKTDIEVRVARARSIDEGGLYSFSTKTIPLGKTTQDIELTSFVVLPKENEAIDGKTLVGAQTTSAILGVITELGDGVYPLQVVYDALHTAGLAPVVKTRAGRKVSMRLSAIQEFFELYVSNTGSVYRDVAVSLKKDNNGMIESIIVKA